MAWKFGVLRSVLPVAVLTVGAATTASAGAAQGSGFEVSLWFEGLSTLVVNTPRCTDRLGNPQGPCEQPTRAEVMFVSSDQSGDSPHVPTLVFYQEDWLNEDDWLMSSQFDGAERYHYSLAPDGRPMVEISLAGKNVSVVQSDRWRGDIRYDRFTTSWGQAEGSLSHLPDLERIFAAAPIQPTDTSRFEGAVATRVDLPPGGLVARRLDPDLWCLNQSDDPFALAQAVELQLSQVRSFVLDIADRNETYPDESTRPRIQLGRNRGVVRVAMTNGPGTTPVLAEPKQIPHFGMLARLSGQSGAVTTRVCGGSTTPGKPQCSSGFFSDTSWPFIPALQQ